MEYFLIKYVNENSSANGKFFVVSDNNNEHFYFQKSLDGSPLVGGGTLKKAYCKIQYDENGNKIILS